MSRIAHPPKSFLSCNFLLPKDMLWHDLPAGKHLVSSLSNQPINSSRFFGMNVLNQMNSVSRKTGHSSDLLLRLHCRFFNTSSIRVSLELGSQSINKDIIRNNPNDAHFISYHKNIFGVADGYVHGQKDVGNYSHSLMYNANRIANQEKPICCDDWPCMILEKAVCMTEETGGSTACILALEGQEIIAAQVGNSGFMVIRNGKVAYRSPMLLHYFNSPIYVSSSGSQLAKTMKVPVEVGDIIVAATDGLFHNIFNDNIVKITMEEMRDNDHPGFIASSLACVASRVSLSRTCDTPFWKARREVCCTCVDGHFVGGKLDDITVVVGKVVVPKFVRRYRALGGIWLG